MVAVHTHIDNDREHDKGFNFRNTKRGSDRAPELKGYRLLRVKKSHRVTTTHPRFRSGTVADRMDSENQGIIFLD